MIEKKSFTYKHQANCRLSICCLFACWHRLSKRSQAYSVMRCFHFHKTSFWICTSYSSQQSLRTFSPKMSNALLLKKGGTNAQVHQMPFQVYPKGLWEMQQLSLQRIFKKHKPSASKLGRGREDERGRIAERSPRQNTSVYTKSFVWGIVCSILTLSWIHLSFKYS